MIYRVTVVLATTNQGFATGFYNHAKALVTQAITLNPGQHNAEPSFARLEHCFHDEPLHKPCELVDEEITP